MAAINESDWLIREASPHDHRDIRDVNRLAFWTDTEGVLVDRLHAEGAVIVSLVAVAGNQIVGHVLFARVFVRDAAGVLPGVCLAPLAVRPHWRSRGIGSALVHAGLAVCWNRAERFAVVLGDNRFCTRFGFSAERARQLQSVYSVQGNAWMAMELREGALTGVQGEVIFPEAFSAADMMKDARGGSDP
jgi:putative acetyltransferase